MKEQEASDLAELLTKVTQAKINGFEYAVALSRMTDVELGHCGHRNGVDRAMADSIRSRNKEIEKLNKEYVRKYPD